MQGRRAKHKKLEKDTVGIDQTCVHMGDLRPKSSEKAGEGHALVSKIIVPEHPNNSFLKK